MSSSEEEEEEIVVPVKKKRRRKKKKNKDPNRPKRNQSAFFLYSNANRDRVKSENPGIKFGEVAKLLSQEFKSLSAREKTKWDKMADKDKIRYNKEMENYDPPTESSSSEEEPRKKKKDPNKPKRNMSAFFLYSNAVRSTVKETNPEAKFGDIARIISAQFKALPDHDRAKWDRLAEQDKERYNREMVGYVPPSESSDDEPRKKKKKKKKDPNAPKRNQSAFFLYSNAVRATVRQENPEAKFGDIAKIISVQFKALNAKQRSKWDTLAAKDKERYQAEMEAYQGGH